MTKKEREFAKLCWWLIERKVAYYKPELVHESWRDKVTTHDDDYDAAEQRYLMLVRELLAEGKDWARNTIVHKRYPGFEDIDFTDAMMEVDVKRPSVQRVIYKLGLDEQTRRPPTQGTQLELQRVQRRNTGVHSGVPYV